MGSVIENEKTKEKCQIFTPDDIVKSMLDHLGYVVGKEGFIDPCSEEYDQHLERLADGSIAGMSPLGKYMHKTLQLYLKRHAIVHNMDKLKRKRKELEDNIAADKKLGKDCSKKEAALQLVTKDFFEYFDMWEHESKGPA